MDVFAVSESMVTPGEEKPDGNSGADGQPEEANKFQRAISAWRGTNCLPLILRNRSRADICDILQESI